MARNLCPDLERASIAVMVTLIILSFATSVAQIGAIVLGGLAGLWLCRNEAQTPSGQVDSPVSRSVGLVALAMFFLLLAVLPALRSLTASSSVALFDASYRSAHSSSAAATSCSPFCVKRSSRGAG
jgi:chromate transporter